MEKKYFFLFKSTLDKICIKYKYNSLLLSGGLDSSILAYHIRPENAITVVLNETSPDYDFSIKIAKKFSKNHQIIYPTFIELIKNIEELIKEFKIFDPIFLRNSVIQFIGLKAAKNSGYETLVLGDGSDELFAGYNFLLKYLNNPEQLKVRIKNIINNMDFFSEKMSKILNIKIFLPFLEKEIFEFERDLDIKDKISIHQERLYGKYFLRVCYEDVLGKEIVWREKNAIEKGSGIDQIIHYIDKELIEDKKFKLQTNRIKKDDKVILRDKEHLYYYNIYRRYFDPPYKETGSVINQGNTTHKRICPYCRSLFIWNGNYCKKCGSYPIIL